MMTMKNTDEIHKITEAVYKNLVENFNNGIRQLLLTGKAYHKALSGVTAAAHAYNDALTKIGTIAKMCRGGTDELGVAIVQIAEAQKAVQAQLEDSTKALFSELILPMEQKLEKEFKKVNTDAKKYSQGHKVVMSPYTKAFDSLKKFRKKTKNKYVYDNEKEAQHMRTLSKCQEKLDEYRVQGLKTALLTERKCHCFLLQRLCTISGVNSMGHRRGLDLYSPLGEWRDLCSNPQVLPPQADQFIAQHLDDDEGIMNGGPSYQSNGFLHRDNPDTQSLGDELRRSKSTQDLYRRSGHFDGTKTLPPRIPPPPTISPQVQAMYSFTTNVESQLSFIEGDIITLMGEKSDGWQYGENSRTQMNMFLTSTGDVFLHNQCGITTQLYRGGHHYIDGGEIRWLAVWGKQQDTNATYSFTTNVESQLSFIEDDIITLMGEKSDGWQYGENSRTQMLGWFPLSFTQPVAVTQGRESPEHRFMELQRFKSVGDLLDSRSLSEHHHFMYDHDIPGNIRRPKSLYDGPSSPHRNRANTQAVRPIHVPITHSHGPTPIYSHQTPIFNPYADPDQLYQHVPFSSDYIQPYPVYTRRDLDTADTTSLYSAYGKPIKTATEKGFTPVPPSRNSPPLPPPPPETSHAHVPPETDVSQSHTTRVRRMTNGAVTPSAPSLPAPNPPNLPPPPPPNPPNFPPPPPMSNPPLPPMTTRSSLHANNSKISTTQNPTVPSTAISTLSKSVVNSLSHLSQQSPQSPGVTTPSSSGYGSPARQPNKPPPPPPPPPQSTAWNQPDEDYGTEDDTNFKTNPMFSSVSLRRTRTNDRSAPKLN